MSKKSLIIAVIVLFVMLVSVIIILACSKDGKDGKDGADGITPTIEISDDGYWVINGEKTNVPASGNSGDGGAYVDDNPQGLDFYKQDDGTYIVSAGHAKYLSTIVIPATYKGGAVVGIDNEAFLNCSSLTSVVIPDSVTSIGDYAFRNCSSLESVVIPDRVTSIGVVAFQYCSSLESIVIPDSVKSIGDYAFLGCSSLESVYITDIEAWCNISFNDYNSNPMCNGANLYLNGELVTDININDTVSSIKDYAFYDCTSLESVVIPDSVTSIGGSVFSGCSSLTSIKYRGSEEQWESISKGDRWDEYYENGSYYKLNYTITYNYDGE